MKYLFKYKFDFNSVPRGNRTQYLILIARGCTVLKFSLMQVIQPYVSNKMGLDGHTNRWTNKKAIP